MNLQNLRHNIHTRPKHLRQQNQEHAHIPQPEHPQPCPPRFPGPRHLRCRILILAILIDGPWLVPDEIIRSLVGIGVITVGLDDRQGGIGVVPVVVRARFRSRSRSRLENLGLVIGDFGEEWWGPGVGGGQGL